MMEANMKTTLVTVASILVMVFSFLVPSSASGETEMAKTALILIDIQNFYFPGGKSEIVDPEPASVNAKKVLEKARADGMLIVHVRHNSEPGGEIHVNVRPKEGEKVISKDEVNAFKGTDLLDTLKSHEIERVVITGMMTHMCVEAATRAAADFGFEVVVVQDACATRDLEFGGVKVSAKDVHTSTLATLNRYYGKIVDTKAFLEGLE
jgi:nicotinamidase-related amidase